MFKTTFKSTLIFLFLLNGCAIGPDYKAPNLAIPETFNSSGEGKEFNDVAKDWWLCFSDPVLEELVKLSAENNNSIQAAVARLEQSISTRRGSVLSFFPGGKVTATSVRFRNSNQGQFSGFGSGNTEQEYSAIGASASWEIDLFGQLRRELEGSSARADAAGYALADMERIIIADTIQQYLILRGAQARLIVAKNNLDLQRSTSEITRSLTDGGELSGFDLQRTISQFKVTEAEIPSLDSVYYSALNTLSALTKVPASELQIKIGDFAPVKVCDVGRNFGVPSDLLRRRPDLREAERQLAAATADVGVEIGEYFPKFELLGNIGYEAINFGALNRRGDESYSFGPSVSVPLLQYSRIYTKVTKAKFHVVEMLNDYEGKVLYAIAEADDAIVQLRNHTARYASLREAAQASAKATEIARDRYKIGEIDLLTILDVQRTQLETESALAIAEQERGLAVVLLYRALGGGWSDSNLI